jgi:hypothetical protein
MEIKKKEIFGEKRGFLPLEHIPGEAQADFRDAAFMKTASYTEVNT